MLLLLLFVASTAADPQLVHLQTLWRHGDRTPLNSYRYKGDPYDETTWKQPWGELTTLGMAQHFAQGRRLRSDYVDKYRLLGPEYHSEQVAVRASYSSRTITSAMSNLAAMFQHSQSSHPNGADWPTNWTPIPVYPLPYSEDYLLIVGKNCPKKYGPLKAARAIHRQYVQFLKDKQYLIDTIVKNTGDVSINTMEKAGHFLDTVMVEKAHNLAHPAWMSDSFLADLKATTARSIQFMLGAADFGHNDKAELSQVLGGPLLREMLQNMQDAMNGAAVKYHVYSAHDDTLMALLESLGALSKVLPGDTPHSAATLALELWKGDDGKYSVRMRYSDDANNNFRPVTQFVSGCPQNDMCPLDTFIQRSQTFIPPTSDMNTWCNA